MCKKKPFKFWRKKNMILNSDEVLTTANAVINRYLKIVQEASQKGEEEIIKTLFFRIKSFIEVTYIILFYSNTSVSLDFKNFKSKFKQEAEQVYEYISSIISDNCLSYCKDGLAYTCNYHPETLEDKGLNLFFVRSLWTYDKIISNNFENTSKSKPKKNKMILSI